ELVFYIVRARASDAADAPDRVNGEREHRDDRRREEREGRGVLGDVALPRFRALERGEVVPEVHHRPDTERANREERGEPRAQERTIDPRGGGGRRGRRHTPRLESFGPH